MTPEAKLLILKYKGSGKKLGLEYSTLLFENFVIRELTDYQRGAVISFIDNRGSGDFLKSRLLKILNTDAYPEWELRAAAEFLNPAWSRWQGKLNKGMQRRRERERKLFLMPILVVHNKGAAK